MYKWFLYLFFSFQKKIFFSGYNFFSYRKYFIKIIHLRRIKLNIFLSKSFIVMTSNAVGMKYGFLTICKIVSISAGHFDRWVDKNVNIERKKKVHWKCNRRKQVNIKGRLCFLLLHLERCLDWFILTWGNSFTNFRFKFWIKCLMMVWKRIVLILWNAFCLHLPGDWLFIDTQRISDVMSTKSLTSYQFEIQ